MSDSGASDPAAAASASLRDTAKWLVGGVTATAVGIFAGSSLTRLGSLDFVSHPARLLAAIAGLAAGFAALAMILRAAIRVLTVEAVSFRELADAKTGTLGAVCAKLEAAQRGALPGNAADFAALLEALDAAWVQRDDAARTLMADFAVFQTAIMRQAGFLNVKAKFDQLVTALWRASPLAIIGFGMFAWAANPPEDKPPPAKAPLLVINRP